MYVDHPIECGVIELMLGVEVVHECLTRCGISEGDRGPKGNVSGALMYPGICCPHI